MFRRLDGRGGGKSKEARELELLFGRDAARIFEEEREANADARAKQKANLDMIRQLRSTAKQRERLGLAIKEVETLGRYLPPTHINLVEAKRNLQIQKKKTEELSDIRPPGFGGEGKTTQPNSSEASAPPLAIPVPTIIPTTVVAAPSITPPALASAEPPQKPPTSPLISNLKSFENRSITSIGSSGMMSGLSHPTQSFHLSDHNKDIEIRAKAAFAKLEKASKMRNIRAQPQMVYSSMNYYLDPKQFAEDYEKYKDKILFHTRFIAESKIANIKSRLPKKARESSDLLFRGRPRSVPFSDEVMEESRRFLRWGMVDRKSQRQLSAEEQEIMAERLATEDPKARREKLYSLVQKTWLEDKAPPRQFLTAEELEESRDRLYYQSMQDNQDKQQALKEKYYPEAEPLKLTEEDLDDLAKRVYYDPVAEYKDNLQKLETKNTAILKELRSTVQVMLHERLANRPSKKGPGDATSPTTASPKS